nr:hypothetical protein CFP56_64580 [Quercus suber]
MSRFVSGGTDERPTERDDAWVQAQQQLDAKHLARLDAAKQDGASKSLYETLQANKAAKQEAFDEKIKLSNQFQSLNEDEVAFLDEVLQSTRARERSVKRETSEQVRAFKLQQEAAAAAELASPPPEPESGLPVDAWTIGPRKRKKERDGSGAGLVKVRRRAKEQGSAFSPGEKERVASEEKPTDDVATPAVTAAAAAGDVAHESKPAAATAPSTKLGIVAYSSDEDE